MKTADNKKYNKNNNLQQLRLNPDWAKLPLFERSKWQRVKFGDVVANVNDTERDPQGAGIERFIGLEHLEPGSLHIRAWGNVADGTTFNRRCRPGQVLFGKRRAYQRKVAVAEFDAVVSGDIYVFAPKDDRLLPELLPFLCLSERFFKFAVVTSAGSLSPRTNWSSIANFEFDLPPLDQQRRIAEVFERLDLMICKWKDALSSANKLRLAHLQSAFRGQNKYPKLAVSKTGQVQLGRQRAPKYQTGDHTHPYLRVANVFDGHFDYTDVLEMDFDERDFETFKLKPGDILLNEGQSRELVGRCAIYDGAIKNCCFQNTLIRYRAGENIHVAYAFAFFQYCFHFGLFAAIASQTTSIAHLGSDRFGSLLMPIPPENVQLSIANEFENLRLTRDEIQRHLNNAQNLQTTLINL